MQMSGKSLSSDFSFSNLEGTELAQRVEEGVGLPSFFQDNPWLDILAQRDAESSLDFVASETLSSPTIGEAKPIIKPESIANSPITPSAVNIPKELMVRLEVPPELL